ncbi:hypothetical protein BDR04DRAFT_66074 [Suillus decipiens]|nr:hypothetical protein BDR04DRAFT_66074 [Suillus decipiens]
MISPSFLTAWKPTLMCVILIYITWFISTPPCSQSSSAFLARLFLLLHRFRSHNGETTELRQPSRLSALYLNALFARLSSLIRPCTKRSSETSCSRSYPHSMLLVPLSSLFTRSRHLDSTKKSNLIT